MKIRMQAPLMVIGKPTQQGKKDATATYYFALVTQGEEDAGRIRVANADVYNRIEKYKLQLFTFEFNEQYNSFSIVDVEPIKEATAPNTESTGNASNTTTASAPDTGNTPNTDKAPDAPAPDTGKQAATASDKKH